ncbi:sigma-70 family RNA polymerase sigma factor [Xylophilus sp.]|uniref:sigma-70 family RNA polymerase sigma factor n=1 Tax=Xylophilus sp. TaxID=2653893 RepID=UPI0013BB4A19|nr:sigma-70 family RNA polymerase sigma factor [Xylophilus sp.]KAF1044622.1 MAG: putative RNA polymerase sigma factor FecI [Xylophilus sp.]
MPPADRSASGDILRLYTDHHAWLVGWLRRRLDRGWLAADLAQDTFLHLLAAPAPAIREPRPFLATIARRLLASHYRRQALEQDYLDALAALPAPLQSSPEERLLAVRALAALDRGLHSLPARAREAFLLAHLDGLDYAGIAGRLGVSVHAVKKYIVRANQACFFAADPTP